jgi:hypothetical protein
VVPKFTSIASAHCRRCCLYAWLGSLPRSILGEAGCNEVPFPCPSETLSSVLVESPISTHPALPLMGVQLRSALQSAVPVAVTVAMLWLAARRSVGTPSATLLGRLQRRFCLGSPRCSPSHLEYSFPGFLIGTFDLCASWRTERIAMHGAFPLSLGVAVMEMLARSHLHALSSLGRRSQRLPHVT